MKCLVSDTTWYQKCTRNETERGFVQKAMKNEPDRRTYRQPMDLTSTGLRPAHTMAEPIFFAKQRQTTSHGPSSEMLTPGAPAPMQAAPSL